ncbi:unnamed protein product [Arctogadus glacialis]
MDPSGKKRKGGAERARDQKKAALQADATKCLKIADMFAARGHGASTSAAAASTGSGGEDARQQVDEAAMTVDSPSLEKGASEEREELREPEEQERVLGVAAEKRQMG